MEKKFSNIIENAIRLANYWHQGQILFGTEFDYFVHPIAVATILARYDFDEKIIAAGYCHDLLESTDCPEEEIKKACGAEVLNLVDICTEEQLTDYWKKNKEVFIKQLKLGDDRAKAIAVAEQIHDLQVLIENISNHGMQWFNKFYASPDDRLWFDDNLYKTMSLVWDHKILREYDQLIDQFADFLEKLNEDNEYRRKIEGRYEDLMDFDVPEVKNNNREERAQDNDKDFTIDQENFENFEKVSIEKKSERKINKVADNQDYQTLLPAALALTIKKREITNLDLQEGLGIGYLEAFQILREMKRLKIIERTDSIKPRKADVQKAKKLLEELVKRKTSC